MNDIAICGIYCNKCKYKFKNECNGCMVNKGKIFWGECDLYKCCMYKKLCNCGECDIFPCDKLKEWALNENPERIQNLVELRNKKIANYRKLFDKNNKIIRWPKKKDEKKYILKFLQNKLEKEKVYKEKEINEILNDWHLFNDCALLRREMFDNYLINRTKDCREYWVEENDR
jgi:hypothetical protein